MYEKNRKLIIVSFPRSGHHWTNILLHCYFNVPYVHYDIEPCSHLTKQTILREKFWDHTHDIEANCDINKSNKLVKYFVEWCILKLKKHYAKYLIKNETLLMHYEKLKYNFLSEFKKIIIFLNEHWDEEKANIVNNLLTKEHIVNTLYNKNDSLSSIASYMNLDMLSDSYKIKQQMFIDKWGSYIKRELITQKYEEFFNQ